jgi:hypothetical protein
VSPPSNAENNRHAMHAFTAIKRLNTEYFEKSIRQDSSLSR